MSLKKTLTRTLLAVATVATVATIVSLGALAQAADPAENYSIETQAPSVTVAADGTATVTFKVSGEFKWNRDYPARITVDGSPRVVTLDKKVYKQLDGDFAIGAQDKEAQVRIPFKGAASGTEKAALEAKFSVCNASLCQIKKVALALEFRVN